MKQSSQQLESDKSAEEIRKFPLRRLYFFVIFILTLLSPIGLSLQTDDINSLPWRVSATVQITSITVTFLLLAWLPLLIPWLVSLSPRLQNFFIGLRESGIEEIEAGILRIKLSPGIKEAAETYKKKLAEVKENPNNLEKSYKEALSALRASETLSSVDALTRIDEIGSYYDRIRKTLPSGSERTRLLTELSSILWTLMSSANVSDLNLRERFTSTSGGKRLSAYKYLEYAPNLEYLNLLLSRAVGILEEPFGQFSALLALRRMAVSLKLDDSQKKLIVNHLEWAARLEYIGSDRVYLMTTIISILEKKS
ncbi:MAG: hypothetical protein ACOYYJ_06115 [Chloroflexota bacterium]